MEGQRTARRGREAAAARDPRRGTSTRRGSLLRAAGTAAAGTLGSLGAACAGPSGTGAGTAARTTQPVKIVLSTDWTSTTRMAVMEQMKAEFVRAQPHVTVEIEYFTAATSAGGSAGTYSEKVIAQLAGNTIPDVVANWAYFAFAEQLVDLTRDAPAAGWKKAEVVFDARNQEVQGRLYMLSMSASVSGWVYNKTLFGEAGLSEPTTSWTLTDVGEAARKLTRPDKNQWGMRAVDGLWFGPLEVLWAAGAGSTGPTSAELFSAERKKSRLAEAGGLDAFQWYVDLIHRHRVSPSPDEARASNVSFEAGNVGLQPFGVYNSGAAAQRIAGNFDWSAMPIPLDPGTRKRCYDFNSEGFVIPKATQQRGSYEAALRYALSFYSDPVMKLVAQQRGTLPVMRKWIESPEYLSPPPLNLDVIVKTINDRQIIVGDHQQRHPRFSQWNQAVRAEMTRAFSGENAPKPALQAAMEAGDRVLAAP